MADASMVMVLRSALCGGGLLILAGCAGPDRYVRMLGSPDPVERAQATSHLADMGSRGAIPHLIDRLSDEDHFVRVGAVSALRKITGRRFGYNARASQAQRDEAAGRWSDWWEREQ